MPEEEGERKEAKERKVTQVGVYFKILQYERKMRVGIAFYEVTWNKIEGITGGTREFARIIGASVSNVDLESPKAT